MWRCQGEWKGHEPRRHEDTEDPVAPGEDPGPRVLTPRRRRLDRKARDAEVPLQCSQFRQVDWADDIHDGELHRLSHQNGQAAGFVALPPAVNLYEFPVTLAVNCDQSRPAG